MFEGQPKGLYALALANTGERFGYYTMLAIFTLFLQAKFGFTAATTSTIFASFLAGVYFMPLIGGILADKFGYGKMVCMMPPSIARNVIPLSVCSIWRSTSAPCSLRLPLLP